MSFHAQFEQWVPAPLAQVFLFFANPGNLPRIMPPSSATELLELRLVPPPGIDPVQSTVTSLDPLAGEGSEIVTSFRLISFLPFRAQWTARIVEFEWNHYFVDVQQKGPFETFRHRHELFAETRDGVSGTMVRDRIDYTVGFGILGEIAQKLFIARQLQNTFAYRQKMLKHLLAAEGKN
jgi:ligand-binding SRPBCC domain-containing protein